MLQVPILQDQMSLKIFAVLDTLKHAVISGRQRCGSLEVFHLQWEKAAAPEMFLRRL